MKRPVNYAGVLLARASQKSIVLTDQLSILLVPFSTLVVWVAGGKMTSSIQETLAMGVALTVIAVVLLRLLAASYFVWEADQSEKARLEKLLDEEKLRPDRVQRELAGTHIAGLRNELGTLLARQVSFAEIKYRNLKGMAPILSVYQAEFVDTFRRIRDLTNSLSYDVPLRVGAHELLLKSQEIIAAGSSATASDFDLLMKLRKIVFRIIYRVGRSQQHELLALIEMQNLLGNDNFAGGAFADLQKEIKENPDLLHQLVSKI